MLGEGGLVDGRPFFFPVPSGAVRLTGADRVDFLHGQVTNDVRSLATPGAVRALLLSVRGQIEFDLTAYRREKDLYLQTGEGLSGGVAERLQRYIVFDDVQLEDLGERLVVLHAVGLPDGAGFDPAGAPVQELRASFGTVLAGRVDRTGTPGLDLHVLAEHLPALREDLLARGASEISLGEAEGLRVLAGLPDAQRDGFVGLLPQECGLEGAVSYRKGCYVGQEIMARVEARASTQRALARVISPVRFERGASLTSEGREVGRVGKPVPAGDGWTALGVVRKDVPPGSVLRAGDLSLTLAAP